MSPEEKAIVLVYKFDNCMEFSTPQRFAKRCALIAVDEIIESRKDDVAFDDTMWEEASEYYKPHPMYLNYWLQVKQEIEKL
jgi:hypothetical protein